MAKKGSPTAGFRRADGASYSGKFIRRRREWKRRAKRRHYRKQDRAPCGNIEKKFFNLPSCALLSFGKQVVRHSSSPTSIFHGCRDHCFVQPIAWPLGSCQAVLGSVRSEAVDASFRCCAVTRGYANGRCFCWRSEVVVARGLRPRPQASQREGSISTILGSLPAAKPGV